jgi:xylose isomerase
VTTADPADPYEPRPEHKFSFGLWTVGNIGRDPFGEPVRPPLAPLEAVRLLAEVGAWGVNLHDNDLVPIDAPAAGRDRLVRDFRRACDASGLVVPMVTANLFWDPVFRDGAFTANDPDVRAYAIQKSMRTMAMGAELGAKIYVVWGGREGAETDACRRPDEAIRRLRQAINYLCEYSLDHGFGYRLALEAKPNEPRADIYLPTTGAYLGFIATLDHPEMVGVNPELAHEHMAGLNMMHVVAQAWEAGKLFHIDLNDQMLGRYDQDLRFGSFNPRAAFWLVKFLEDVGYEGPRHFDAHAYRTENRDGVKDFARGCMRTYLILKEKARRWNADEEIRQLVAGLAPTAAPARAFSRYSRSHAEALLEQAFDRRTIAGRRLAYERLDQLTMEVLLGVR